MVILTKKKMKKMRNQMIVAAGVSTVAGVGGITVGTIALVKESNQTKKVDDKLQNIEKHLAAVEGSCTKACKTLVPMQQAMFEHGFMIKQ